MKEIMGVPEFCNPGCTIITAARGYRLGARASCSPRWRFHDAISAVHLAAPTSGSVVPGAGAPVRAGYPLAGVSRSQDEAARHKSPVHSGNVVRQRTPAGSDTQGRPPLLAIGGPTASGKTELAIALAERLGGEIVNADSRQVYRGMDIGTAKPTAAQQARVPHHLIAIVDPDQPFSLGLYVRLAHEVIGAIQGRGRLPILAGGTGLYLRAITQGYEVPEVAPDLDFRAQLEAEAANGGLPALVERLRVLDPEGLTTLDTKNPRRVIRALEVSVATGRPFSATQRRDPRYRSLVVLLDGENGVLFPRAGARLDRMLEAGFAAEVARLLAAGYSSDLPAFSALGYRELARVARGECSQEAAVEEIRRTTRAFIRRQRTWFRAEPEANRLDITQPDLVERALALIRAEWGATAG